MKLQCGLISKFDKNSSFDRLFPNQDFHSGKGLGNLIALPFFQPAMENGNSVFTIFILDKLPARRTCKTIEKGPKAGGKEIFGRSKGYIAFCFRNYMFSFEIFLFFFILPYLYKKIQVDEQPK